MGKYADKAIEKAESLLGLEYVYGGDSETNGLDCSHFVWHCIRQAGYPYVGANAYGACVEPMKTLLEGWGWTCLGPSSSVALQKGDVLLRGTSARQAHTGMVYNDSGTQQIDCGGGHNVVATNPPGAQHGVAVRTMTSWDYVMRYENDPPAVEYPIYWCGD